MITIKQLQSTLAFTAFLLLLPLSSTFGAESPQPSTTHKKTKKTGAVSVKRGNQLKTKQPDEPDSRKPPAGQPVSEKKHDKSSEPIGNYLEIGLWNPYQIFGFHFYSKGVMFNLLYDKNSLNKGGLGTIDAKTKVREIKGVQIGLVNLGEIHTIKEVLQADLLLTMEQKEINLNEVNDLDFKADLKAIDNSSFFKNQNNNTDPLKNPTEREQGEKNVQKFLNVNQILEKRKAAIDPSVKPNRKQLKKTTDSQNKQNKNKNTSENTDTPADQKQQDSPFIFKTTGVQLGILLNHSGQVTGLQGGVLYNHATNLTGLQLGGIWNMADTVKGVQAGGLYLNSASGSVTGAQVGGIHNNVVGNLLGLQAALFLNNSSSEVKGLQLGAVNNSLGHITGLQLGFMNASMFNNGAQIGIGNRNHKFIRGLQLGGMNLAEEVHGVQIGLFNYVHKINGLQIGLINVITSQNKRFVPFINGNFYYKGRYLPFFTKTPWGFSNKSTKEEEKQPATDTAEPVKKKTDRGSGRTSYTFAGETI